MLIGEILKLLRVEKGLSQKQIADALDLTQSAIANYENNIRQPNLKLLVSFADYFEVSSDYLLNRSSRDAKLIAIDSNLIDVTDFFVNLLLDDSKSSSLNYAQLYLEFHGLKALYFSLFRLSLTKIGWLWETNQISSAREHLISEIIEEMIVKFKPNQSVIKNTKFLLVTVQGERHTYGIKMISNLLSTVGYDCQYVGEGVPLEDLKTLISKNKPDVVVLSITSTLFQNILLNWLEALNNVTVALVGPGTKGLDLKKYKQVNAFENYESCYDYYKERKNDD